MGNRFVLRTAAQPCPDSPKSKLHDDQRPINEVENVLGKYSLLNDFMGWRSCSGVPLGYVCLEFAFGSLGVGTTQAS